MKIINKLTRVFLYQFAAALVIVVVLTALHFLPFFTNKSAAAIGISQPFGGRVAFIFPCTCTPGLLQIVVGPPKPGTFMIVPGASRVFSSGPVLPGNWVLGTALRPVKIPCLIGAPPFCLPLGISSFVTVIGSSLP